MTDRQSRILTSMRSAQASSNLRQFTGTLFHEADKVRGDAFRDCLVTRCPSADGAVSNPQIGRKRNLPTLPVESAASADEKRAGESHSGPLEVRTELGFVALHVSQQELKVAVAVFGPVAARQILADVVVHQFRGDAELRAPIQIGRIGHVRCAQDGCEGRAVSGIVHIGSPTQFRRALSPVHVLNIGL